MGALDQKVAVITGATSGIGACTAELFAAEGAEVVIAGRRRQEGEQLARTLGASFFATDVTIESDVQALIAHAIARFGRLDVMVNNAGAAGGGGGVADVDLDRFQRTFALHVGGVLLGMKYAARVMLDHEAGSIITIASINGRLAGWASLDYSSAKAAVIHLTRCAAVELGEHGIRVNSISPGPILTGIFGKGAGIDPAEADRTASALEPAFLQALEAHQPDPPPRHQRVCRTCRPVACQRRFELRRGPGSRRRWRHLRGASGCSGESRARNPGQSLRGDPGVRSAN